MHYTDRALLADRSTCPGAGVAVFLSVARIRDSAPPPQKNLFVFFLYFVVKKSAGTRHLKYS